MKLPELARLAFHFARTRWHLKFRTRAALEAWQARQIKRFLAAQLPRTAFYRRFAGSTLAQLPIIDKSVMLANFAAMNDAGITLDEATSVALASEASRDFAPALRGVTVGLSSGTQGPRGIFMASDQERSKWAGIMLARVLPPELLRPLLLGGRRGAAIRVAFFLRANSNLYTTLNSKRVDFRFYDLLHGLDGYLEQVQQHNPDILVAPARILGRLAELQLAGKIKLQPRRVIAVAEVLEPDDRQRITQAFGGLVHQLYQCTEGFLGYTCERGVLHLNEEFVHIEPEWLDQERKRFVPIVTDFTRTTQQVIRYRLNDVLRVRDAPCTCGRVTLALEAIEGRCDDILWLPRSDNGAIGALYPDMLRHAVTTAPHALPDYRIEQHGLTLRIAVVGDAASTQQVLIHAITAVALRQGLQVPDCIAMPFVDTEVHVKRRRIICRERPERQS